MPRERGGAERDAASNMCVNDSVYIRKRALYTYIFMQKRMCMDGESGHTCQETGVVSLGVPREIPPPMRSSVMQRVVVSCSVL